jgi:hypothetical protein
LIGIVPKKTVLKSDIIYLFSAMGSEPSTAVQPLPAVQPIPAVLPPEVKYSQISLVDIPEYFTFGTSLQSMLDTLSSETVDDVFEFISQHPSNIHESYQILVIFFNHRPHQSSLFLDLIAHISAISPFPSCSVDFIRKNPVLGYKLIEKGIIPKDIIRYLYTMPEIFRILTFTEKFWDNNYPTCFTPDPDRTEGKFPIEDIRRFGYDSSSIGFFLKFDKFDEIQQLSSLANFNFSSKTFITPCDLPHPTKLPSESLLSVSAFYGSIGCFKFIFLNGIPIRSSVCISSVKGGNLEIIQICELEHGDFSLCLSASVSYLRNDIADWLLNNFSVKKFTLEDCIRSLNFPALLYALSQGADVNEKSNEFPLLFFPCFFDFRNF